jgi:Rrf2 family iron-sulfur cluster assembly transcriptional regulator
MKINTKSRVAIAAILDVAVHGAHKPVPLTDVSERQRVSLSYLEQLFQKLRQKGYVASHRGPGGGYQINRRLATISVADIICAVDREAFGEQPSQAAAGAETSRTRVTDELWGRVNNQLHDYLRSVTLESVLAEAGNASAPDKPVAEAAATPRVSHTQARREEMTGVSP